MLIEQNVLEKLMAYPWPARVYLNLDTGKRSVSIYQTRRAGNDYLVSFSENVTKIGSKYFETVVESMKAINDWLENGKLPEGYEPSGEIEDGGECDENGSV